MEEFEDTDYIASEHDHLISEVSKLDKTQHITEPTRNEPSLLNTEFNLIKRSNKLDLNKVAKVLTDTASHVKIGKKLKRAQDEKRVLSKPLEKPQAERVKRATGYEQTKKQVGRWDPVVARSRSSDYVSFPLKHVTSKIQPTDQFLSKFKLKSELEKELDEVDPPAEIEEEENEEQVYPMSYEEMVERRQHLAKMRAQQSYVAAKAKRQSKIKSKKYHRILKKEKLKLQLKEFEELQKTNPEEALKKLEALEKTRALERHTLRHKNTGKWARNKMVRAKYDKEVRSQLAEQLAVGRSLTQKTQDVESSDDEDDGQMIPDIALAQDPMNPWMMSQKDKSNVNFEFNFGYKKYLNNRILKNVNDSDSDGEANVNKSNVQDNIPIHNDLAVLKEGINKLYSNNNKDDNDRANQAHTADISKVESTKYVFQDDQEATVEQSKKDDKLSKCIRGIIKTRKTKVSKTVATSNWIVENIEVKTDKIKNSQAPDVSAIFKTLESKTANKVERKLKRLRQDIEELEKSTEKPKRDKKKKLNKSQNKDNLEYLKLKNKKTKVVIDEALLESSSKQADSISNIAKNENSIENLKAVASVVYEQTSDSQQTPSDIDPTRFIEVKPKFLNSVMPEGDTELDQLDDDEQVVPRVNIEEVFEEDDVVASFRQEKEDEINKDKEDDISLTLPGWGTWGGKGVKVKTPKRRKNRFIQKPAPVMPRRDENKGDIIIKEYKDPKLQTHKVKELPYPFKSVKDYEASIRAPLGNTFIPEKPFKQLIRPSVITKAGVVIEPMDEEELLLPKRRKFHNRDIIKVNLKK